MNDKPYIFLKHKTVSQRDLLLIQKEIDNNDKFCLLPLTNPVGTSCEDIVCICPLAPKKHVLFEEINFLKALALLWQKVLCPP